jgi:Flp pilus assembly pilin Flp
MLLRAQAFASGVMVHLRGPRLESTLTRGQGLAEYALILALIAIVAIVALLFLGGQVSKILSTVGKSV